MIKPAWSGDLRITTVFSPPISLSQYEEGVITGGTNHHVQQLNHIYLEDRDLVLQRAKDVNMLFFYYYLNVSGPSITRNRMKGNL